MRIVSMRVLGTQEIYCTPDDRYSKPRRTSMCSLAPKYFSSRYWWVALKCSTFQSNRLHISDPRIEKKTSELVQIRIFGCLGFILAKLW